MPAQLIRSLAVSILNLPARAKRLYFRLRGIQIDRSATIHWSASIEPGGGEVSIGARTGLDRGVILRAYGGSISIGADCTVNPYSVLYGDGGLKIGNGVRIAAHCVIVPANHVYADPSRYIFEQGQTNKGVLIEDDVWIGAGAKILDGVVLSKGSVIGAGAVVTKATERFGVYAGCPARKIASRLSKAEP